MRLDHRTLLKGLWRFAKGGSHKGHPSNLNPRDGRFAKADPINRLASFAVLRPCARMSGNINGPLSITSYSAVKCAEIPGNGRVVDLSHTRSVPVPRQTVQETKARLADDRLPKLRSLTVTAKGRRVFRIRFVDVGLRWQVVASRDDMEVENALAR